MKIICHLKYWYWSIRMLVQLFPYFSPFTLHSNCLCSLLVTQCHIDFMISEAVFSFQLSYNHLFARVTFLFQSLWVQIIWRNFSHLRVSYLFELIFWAHFTKGRERPSWQSIPYSLGRGKRLSLASTRHLPLRQWRKRVTSPIICHFQITAWYQT